MAGSASGNRQDPANGSIAEVQDSLARALHAPVDDQTLADREQTQADSDQTGSERDQTAADSDQTAADSDQTAADSDQTAAERDQAASDRDLAHGGDQGSHDLTRDLRDRSALQRQMSAVGRVDSAAARDDAARERDLAASERDRAATVVIADLRPPTLDQLGLRAAIEALAQRVAKDGLIVEVHVELAPDHGSEGQCPSSELEIAIYRIVQEALSNALKSGRATRGAIDVIDGETTIEVTVKDDGAGFDIGGPTGGLACRGCANAPSCCTEPSRSSRLWGREPPFARGFPSSIEPGVGRPTCQNTLTANASSIR